MKTNRITGFVIAIAILGFTISNAFPEMHGIPVSTRNNAKPKDHLIACSFGVEQWENGKKSESLWEQWFLTLSDIGDKIAKPNISLERVRYMKMFEDDVTIFINKYSNLSGNLLLRNLDWDKGVFALTILNAGLLDEDGARTEVSIKMEWRKDILYMTDFKALSATRGLFDSSQLNAVEYRIPEYTYIKRVPIKLTGFRDNEQR